MCIRDRDGDKSISLTAEGGKVFFKMAGVKSDKIQFVSSVEKCRNAEIFVDGRTIEVYLNDGEDVGTRLYYNSNRQGIFCLNSEKLSLIHISSHCCISCIIPWTGHFI